MKPAPLFLVSASIFLLAFTTEPKTGREIFLQVCATCHGNDGRGVPEFPMPLKTPRPDFTDCGFATREPDTDWLAVAHQGGPARGFSVEMPAHGGMLSVEELQNVLDYIRSLCSNDNWPRGELNLPRPLVTEKAYPEDEAVVTSSIDVENDLGVRNKLIYEKRFGARNQIELIVPFSFRETAGDWSSMEPGDVAVGLKRALFHSVSRGTILSLAAEVKLPTGNEKRGFGSGTTIIEPFVSVGQLLSANVFLHLQTGAEIPVDPDKASREAFLRAVLGKTLTTGAWGRAWSPMVEVLTWRDLESGADIHWDLVPQMQVTLNKRQHIMFAAGVRVPMDTRVRDAQVVAYLLWDWFDGGFFEGW